MLTTTPSNTKHLGPLVGFVTSSFSSKVCLWPKLKWKKHPNCTPHKKHPPNLLPCWRKKTSQPVSSPRKCGKLSKLLVLPLPPHPKEHGHDWGSILEARNCFLGRYLVATWGSNPTSPWKKSGCCLLDVGRVEKVSKTGVFFNSMGCFKHIFSDKGCAGWLQSHFASLQGSKVDFIHWGGGLRM